MKLHTHFTRGKRLMVILRDGTSFIDKFVATTRTHMVFETVTVKLDRIRSATINKSNKFESIALYERIQ